MTVKIVTLYRVSTGEITGTSYVDDEVVLPDDCAAIRAEIDGSRYYIVDGEPVEFPPRPHRYANFDWTTHQWVDPRSLDDRKSEAKVTVLAWVSSMLARFTDGYPAEEVAAWGNKLTAARRVLEGHSEAIITIEAQALGVTPAVLAARVVQKGSGYESIVALAAAIRGRTYTAIDAAPDAAAVETVVTTALADAAAALAALGVS